MGRLRVGLSDRKGGGLHIKLLTVEFIVPGCRSLKEKRGRLLGMKDKFGREPNMAVCESDYHDDLDRAQWSFVAVGNSKKVLSQMLARVENHVEEMVDAVVINTAIENI